MVTGAVKSGQVIARVRASDADAGANAVLTYSLHGDPIDDVTRRDVTTYSLQGDAHRMFTIAPETGEIRMQTNARIGPKSEARSNDADKPETLYHLVVVASDGGAITSCITYAL